MPKVDVVVAKMAFGKSGCRQMWLPQNNCRKRRLLDVCLLIEYVILLSESDNGINGIKVIAFEWH
jgi:hypothetical protein